MLERFVIPRLGNHRVNEVTRADIAQLHHELRHIAHARQSLPGNDLQDVQSRRDVGAAAGTDRTRASTSRNIRRRSASGFSAQPNLKRVGEAPREMEAEGIELPSSVAAMK